MNKRIDILRNALSENECAFISSYPNIFYFSGFTSEDAYLLISCDKKIIITDSRYIVQAKEQCPEFEIINISEGFSEIFKKITENDILYEEQDISVGFYISLKKLCSKKNFIPASNKISEFRRIKDKSEIKAIHQAEQLGDLAFEYILKLIKPDMTEISIAAELEYFFRKHGASKLSFDTVVASGYRSSMPHGTASEKKIQKGEFLTLDFGCVLDGYCSDMTRTVVMGEADAGQKEIYSLVLAAQKAGIESAFSGKKCSEVDAAARKVIEDAGYGKYFSHSLGHSVGIEIHENPNFSPKSKDFAEGGNVITVEPGIYIEDFGGVRIEDIIVIGSDFVENITKSEKELIII